MERERNLTSVQIAVDQSLRLSPAYSTSANAGNAANTIAVSVEETDAPTASKDRRGQKRSWLCKRLK
jgi:hypothetical protein